MAEYSLSEARAQLPLLLTKAAAGEPVTITRHGRPEAVIVGHSEWVRSQARSRVMEQARILSEMREEAKKKSWEDIGWLEDYDADAHVAEIRAGRDYDRWDEVENGKP